MTYWKPIAGYGAAYEVSRCGEIRDAIACRHMKPAPSRTRGYRLKIRLTRYGERRTHWVARLVAEAFLGPAPSPQHEVDHIDFNVQNNRVENLRWLSKQENIQHSVRAGRYAKKLGIGEVAWIIAAWRSGRRTDALAQEMNVHRRTIQKILKGEIWAWVRV